MPPKNLVILRDSQEKKGHRLLFPSKVIVHLDGHQVLDDRIGRPRIPPTIIPVRVKEVSLSYGDYAIEGYERLVGVEAKRSADELLTNTTKGDGPRFGRAIYRFAKATKYPYLYLQMLPLSIWNPKPCNGSMDSMWVLDKVLQISASLGLRLIWGGRISTKESTRRKLGEIILRLMLHHVLEEERNSR